MLGGYPNPRERQIHDYEAAPATLRTTIAFVLLLFTTTTLVLGCVIILFPDQTSHSAPWMAFIVSTVTLFTLSSLVAILRWCHYARPRMPRMPGDPFASPSDASEFPLRWRDLFGRRRIGISSRIGILVTWATRKLVGVADRVFGHGMPPPEPETELQSGFGNPGRAETNAPLMQSRRESHAGLNIPEPTAAEPSTAVQPSLDGTRPDSEPTGSVSSQTTTKVDSRATDDDRKLLPSLTNPHKYNSDGPTTSAANNDHRRGSQPSEPARTPLYAQRGLRPLYAQRNAPDRNTSLPRQTIARGGLGRGSRTHPLQKEPRAFPYRSDGDEATEKSLDDHA
ncbi:hypothetical protein EsH8_IV_001321 [Colletotrichum jinshuiense]